MYVCISWVFLRWGTRHWFFLCGGHKEAISSWPLSLTPLSRTNKNNTDKGEGFPPTRGASHSHSHSHSWVSSPQCLFMWRDRWSDLEKERWHRWHLKGFCPLCFRKWRVSSSDRANFHVHPVHVHWYGFSPVCVLLWALRCELFV